MFDQVLLDECLVELPPLKLVSQQGQNVEAPVREIKSIDAVYPGGLGEPMGEVYRAFFTDGSEGEIFVPGNPLNLQIDQARYLAPGRASNKWDEVKSLFLDGVAGVVPHHVKEALRRYENESDEVAQALFKSLG